MNTTQQNAVIHPAIKSDEGFDLVEALRLLWRQKRIVFGLPVAVAIVAAAASLLIPDVYKSTVKLLPPQQAQSGASALLSQLGGMAGAAAGIAGMKNPNELYVGMLKSRTVADAMVDRFKLQQAYETDSLEKARKKLESDTSIVAGKDGLITIDFESTDKKLVAPIANAYVEELTKLTKHLAVTEASQRRLFFEQQLQTTKNSLAEAEQRLKGGLDRQGVISVDVESRAIAETIARLRAQISSKEVQLASMRAFVTTENPEYRRTNEELSGARAELTKLENGRGTVEPSGNLEAGKSSGLESIKLLRDVKYHQMLYEQLAKQFEIARLDEAKMSAVIQVLDAAVEPERKFKPRRSIIVVLSALGALFFAVIWAWYVDKRAKLV